MHRAVQGSQRLRAAPIPAHHPYVDAVEPLAGWDGFELVAPPELETAGPGTWIPHPLLEAQRLAEDADRVDVLHVHFGFEHRTPQQMRELVEQCRASGIRLVLTVHDLSHPHLRTAQEQREHLERLAVLIEAAETVITLTGSAAEEIHRRFGRRAEVIAHPCVVAPQQARRLQEQVRERGGPSLGVAVFLKDLRASTVRELSWHRDLAEGLRGVGARLTVFLDERAAGTELGRGLSGIQGLELVVHRRMDDERLFTQVAECAVVVLPYLRGTHSGWLEMCRDLGVVVVAPDCGHFADQADQPGAVLSCRTGDGRDAARAAAQALGVAPLPWAGDRAAQAERIALRHRELLAEAGS